MARHRHTRYHERAIGHNLGMLPLFSHRLVLRSAGERNFHVLYQLLAHSAQAPPGFYSRSEGFSSAVESVEAMDETGSVRATATHHGGELVDSAPGCGAGCGGV